jgi:hypothetical protein
MIHVRELACAWLLALPCLAQQPAPFPRFDVPKDRPRIALAAADVEKLRANIEKEPWAGLWKAVASRSEGVRRGSLDPKDPFRGAPAGQSRRFTATEGLECVAFQALVGQDARAAKDLSAFFEAWDPASLEKDIADNDFMSSGEFFEGLAVVLDWTWDLLTEKARANLRAVVERRARHNYEGFVQKKSWEATTDANNHSMASMGAVGLAAVALWHESKDAPAWAALAREKMRSYLASSFDEDGACYEGTMYGPFGLFRILPFADALTRYAGEDALGMGFLDRVVAQLAQELVPGRQRMMPINDTDGNFRPWGGVLFLYNATRHGNALARWFWTEVLARQAGNGGHTWAFALAWEDGAGGGAPPEKKTSVARGRGTVTVRTGWEPQDFLAAFECGKRIPGTHGQSDVGHFLVYARGRCLAADTGYSNVAQEGTPHQTVGHNLVLCDGRGQAITGGGAVTEGKLVEFVEKKGFVLAHADLANAYAQKGYNPLAVARRAFVVVTGDDPYVVVLDAFAKDAKEHEWTWLLHGNADSTFEHARDRSAHRSGDTALEIVPCPLDSGPLTFETRKFPSGNFGEHPVLHAKFRGKRWFAATVLAVRGGSDAPVAVARAVKSGKLVVTVERGGAKDEIAVAAAPDGRIASVRMLRGKDAEEVKLK